MKKTPAELTALAERVDELFRPDGDLARAFAEGGADYAFSEAQCGLARTFAHGIAAADPQPGEDGKIGAIEAAAGMGKTTAYLAALALNAAMFGEKSLVSTRTRALQRQIEAEWPIVSAAVARMTARVSGEPARVSLKPRIGRRNFIDRERAERMLNDLRRERPDDPRIRKLRIIADIDAPTFDDLRQKTDPDFLTDPDAHLSEADLRLAPASSESAARHFRAALEKSGDADIVVVNHALALLDARLWGGLIAVPSARRVAVFDEADTLPEQARSMADENIRPDILRELLKKFAPEPSAESTLAEINALFADAAELLKNNGDALPMNLEMAAKAESAAAALRQSARETDDAECREELTAAALALRECAKAARENNPKRRSAIVFADPNPNRPALALRVPDPALILSRLWRARAGGENTDPFLRAALFTSATLSPFRKASPEYDPEPFLRTIGADFPGRIASVIPGAMPDRPLEPEAFGKMEMIVLAHRAAKPPYKTGADGRPEMDPEFLQYAALGIEKARETGGRTLVLTSSFAAAESIAAKVRNAILHREGETLDAALDEYRKPENADAVLITPAAWEGVNPLGAAKKNGVRTQNIVIPALPFPPGDPAGLRALGDKLRARGNEGEPARAILFSRTYAAAVRKLRQGIGRGIRAANDICRIWIMDPRFPVPESFCKNPRNKITQGAAYHYLGLAESAVPRRFHKFGGFARIVRILNPDGQFADIKHGRGFRR